MEQYYSYGGASNPDFYYKVNIASDANVSAAFGWCHRYESRGRYYVQWPGLWNNAEYTQFQFEYEETAILFALKFGVQ